MGIEIVFSYICNLDKICFCVLVFWKGDHFYRDWFIFFWHSVPLDSSVNRHKNMTNHANKWRIRVISWVAFGCKMKQQWFATPICWKDQDYCCLVKRLKNTVRRSNRYTIYLVSPLFLWACSLIYTDVVYLYNSISVKLDYVIAATHRPQQCFPNFPPVKPQVSFGGIGFLRLIQQGSTRET